MFGHEFPRGVMEVQALVIKPYLISDFPGCEVGVIVAQKTIPMSACFLLNVMVPNNH